MPTLHWLTREKDLKLAAQAPYRLLGADDAHSYGDLNAGNMIIQGDNLEALKALLPYYAGQVKCIYIDPPYNTKSFVAIEYDDNLEHTKWLSLMYPKLELLRDLLADDGTIWISVDDNESHYLKVVLDEVFGRSNFIASNVWQKRYSRENREAIGDAHEYVILYARNPEKFKLTRNKLPLGDKQLKLYKNPNNHPRGLWQSVSLLAQGYRPNQMYEIVAPNGNTHVPPPGNCWKVIRSEYESLVEQERIYFGKDGNGVPRRMEFLDNAQGLVPWTWWPHEDVGHTDEAKKEANNLFGGEVSFGTPKPERLIQRILHIATNPGDLVLDSFLGSGTTAAVAQKMGRRYIGIEIGDHAVTHCVPRLKKVIDGEQGGISKPVNWQGGGGFRFFRLGDPIFDDSGCIRQGITFAQLAAHIWFSETKQPLQQTPSSPLLGVHDGTAYYLLFNGILKDKSASGGNVLTSKILSSLPPHDGLKVVYGERSLYGTARLEEMGITFKHTPYDIKGR